MKTSFYEILLVPQDAPPAQLRHAYEQSMATLAKRLSAARGKGVDSTDLEEERLGLAEAWRVLSDPVRRARYDRFLLLADRRTPREADELWARVASSNVDPAAAATIDLVRALTQLPVGEGGTPAASPARSAPPAAAPAAPRVAPPPPAAAPPEAQRPAPQPASTQAARAEARVTAGLGSDLPTLVFHLGYSGALIQRLREVKGITLDDVAKRTRIARRYLEAIEGEDFRSLPAATFVRGYLVALARLLDMEPDRLVNGYLARMNQ